MGPNPQSLLAAMRRKMAEQPFIEDGFPPQPYIVPMKKMRELGVMEDIGRIPVFEPTPEERRREALRKVGPYDPFKDK